MIRVETGEVHFLTVVHSPAAHLWTAAAHSGRSKGARWAV